MRKQLQLDIRLIKKTTQPLRIIKKWHYRLRVQMCTVEDEISRAYCRDFT
jgi:hypothetical protein